MRIKLLAAGLLSGFLPVAAIAVPIYGEFTGTVWGVTESGASVPGSIGAGALVSGAFQFENSGQAPYSEIGDGADESRYLSYSDGSFLRISVDSFVWEAAGLHIGVRNDSDVFGDDMLTLVFSTNLQFFDPAFPPASSFPGIPPGLPNSAFSIDLFDSAQMLLSSQALPASVSEINLASTTVRNGGIFGNADGANAFYAINFNVDSVVMRDVPTAVPEPGTLWLMSFALLALWFSTRRRAALASLRKR